MSDATDIAKPWWRYRFMWLVLGGPAAVVVASFATLTLAIKHPDPVIEQTSRPSADGLADAAQQPAMRARNHAATGGQ